MAAHLLPGTPQFVRDGIEAMTQFQCWLFNTDNPRREILHLIANASRKSKSKEGNKMPRGIPNKKKTDKKNHRAGAVTGPRASSSPKKAPAQESRLVIAQRNLDTAQLRIGQLEVEIRALHKWRKAFEKSFEKVAQALEQASQQGFMTDGGDGISQDAVS